MRGADEQTGAWFSDPSLDVLVPQDRLLRAIRLFKLPPGAA